MTPAACGRYLRALQTKVKVTEVGTGALAGIENADALGISTYVVCIRSTSRIAAHTSAFDFV
jgi:hypothetical protein